MKISILTLFPEMFSGPCNTSILKHAQEKKLVTIDCIDIRTYGLGKHRIVDDKAYGGGVGMVMRVDVVDAAIQETKDKNIEKDNQKVVLLSPHGKPFTQQKAQEFAKLEQLVLICGHYEGVDERIKASIDEEISIGDFITTGGEIPAMLITDSVVRLIPLVLKPEATNNESFSLLHQGQHLLEFPQYTTPREYNNLSVPEVLLSGNHKDIATWRKNKSIEVTKKLRPDLINQNLP